MLALNIGKNSRLERLDEQPAQRKARPAASDGKVNEVAAQRRDCSRTYIAGFIRNSPENMSLSIQDPQKALPDNAMPRMASRRRPRATLRLFSPRHMRTR
jgi:hypothetical protein